VTAAAAHGELRSENTFPAFALFVLLLFGDLAFTVLHLIYVETGFLRGMRISLESDGGPSEIYQYVKEFWLIVCMVIAFVSTRHRVFLSWALVFTFLLADDAGQIHENLGSSFSERYQLPAPFGVRPKDIGEMIVGLSAGLIALIVVLAGLWRSTEQCRRISRDLAVMVVALGVAGILVDMVHVVAYYSGSLLAQLLIVIEDGGEMVIMSALTAYAFHVASHSGVTRLNLWSAVTARWRARAITPPRHSPAGDGRT
jgi:hypothetical protein